MNTFKEFYNRQRRKFLSYLIRRSGDYYVACDIMQESFARLYEKYTAEGYTPQLLYTIGRNLALDSLRKRKTHPAALEEDHPSADSQEHYLMVRDEYRRVLAAMRHLEDDERDLLALVVSSDMPYRELARITGISEANVKVKIHRARKKLRAYLKAGTHE
ncbi:MAG: RNA polymerase sigma factor [Desulfobacteraceae bacterium]|nr:MAG: RNA polymerase sigma factor [Desulfobacteraceae bacterium]